MNIRPHWRSGFRLSKGLGLQVWNAKGRAEREKDLDYARRLRAVWLVGRKLYTQKTVAEILEVTESCVWEWVRTYRKRGIEGLRPGKARGATPKMTADQKTRLARWIRRGPEACGYDTGVWTGPLVQQLILKRYKVTYSVAHVRKLLHRLHFSVQYPKKVLSEASHRDQARWLREEYPRIKKKPGRKALRSCSRTSASSARKAP